MPTQAQTSIAFAHAPRADGSCFQTLIPTLQAEGPGVTCSPHGLDRATSSASPAVSGGAAAIVLIVQSCGGALVHSFGNRRQPTQRGQCRPRAQAVAWDGSDLRTSTARR
jgi:hypothetical protein